MGTRRNSRPRQAQPDVQAVFLNIPYDKPYTPLYLALISGICTFGLVPRATIEIPGGERRLDRIFALIRGCKFSVHDLSRVQLARTAPRTPRFNMPFELGLAVAWAKMQPPNAHLWIVMEARARRLNKSLSDLDGTDVYIHDGKPAGVFRELGNLFVRGRGPQPTVQQMEAVYRGLKKEAPRISKEAGATSFFTARVFKNLVVLARTYAELYVGNS